MKPAMRTPRAELTWRNLRQDLVSALAFVLIASTVGWAFWPA